jgi:hypothetical protein
VRRRSVLYQRFPELRRTHFRITSPPNHNYNCIAWAVGDPENCWIPDEEFPEGVFRWPEGAPRENTVQGWTAAFMALGYHACPDGALEPGFDKVAIYALNDGAPKHVARQLPSGLWTSKLGTMEDIEHDLEGLVGERYGSVVAFLRRPSDP